VQLKLTAALGVPTDDANMQALGVDQCTRYSAAATVSGERHAPPKDEDGTSLEEDDQQLQQQQSLLSSKPALHEAGTGSSGIDSALPPESWQAIYNSIVLRLSQTR
jgi:hypothetical protein